MKGDVTTSDVLEFRNERLVFPNEFRHDAIKIREKNTSPDEKMCVSLSLPEGLNME